MRLNCLAPNHRLLRGWRTGAIMAKKYDDLPLTTKGAWVVHHGLKTSATLGAGAEFPALETAGKAATLLSQFAATEQETLEKKRVDALAQAAGLNPRTEVPELMKMLVRQRLIDVSTGGDVEVLGVTSHVAAQHAARMFESGDPTTREKASIALAEITSDQPRPLKEVSEFIGDEFQFTKSLTADFLQRAEAVGFVDGEGTDGDRLLFNGNLFRKDSVEKCKRVLDSLSQQEVSKVNEFDEVLSSRGCVIIEEAEIFLGEKLLSKLRAASMYDVNIVANPLGEYAFVTRPSAFHKFNDPMADDAFDLAKALVAALTYGMTLSTAGRGKISTIKHILGNLIKGMSVGPATAIGEDYRVLEEKGVIRVTPGSSYGYTMVLRKKDIGQLALAVLSTGDGAASSAIDRILLPGSMTGYSGPEKARVDFRKRQLPPSKQLTQSVLDALRTRGGL